MRGTLPKRHAYWVNKSLRQDGGSGGAITPRSDLSPALSRPRRRKRPASATLVRVPGAAQPCVDRGNATRHEDTTPERRSSAAESLASRNAQLSSSARR